MNVPVPGIGVAELDALLRDGAALIDVREPHEFEEAHVPAARLVPLQSVPEAAGSLSTTDPVYVICHSGGRSQRAVQFLREQGIDAVNVLGGTSAWIQAGYAVEAGLPDAGS